MIKLPLEARQFGQQMREFFRKQSQGCRTVHIDKQDHIYTSGQRDGMVYFIERGLVKLLLPSQEGKECLLSVRAQGDIFGELCLSGQTSRLETAVAMQDVALKQISYRSFLLSLKQESLLEGLIQYLAVRIAEQQEVIAGLATENSEQRLAKTLLYLSQRHGTADACGTCLGLRLSHEELSAMVGTTRPRIGIFLKKFRALGLIRLGEDRCFIIEEAKLADYLLQDPSARQCGEGGTDNVRPGNPGPLTLSRDSSGL